MKHLVPNSLQSICLVSFLPYHAARVTCRYSKVLAMLPLCKKCYGLYGFKLLSRWGTSCLLGPPKELSNVQVQKNGENKIPDLRHWGLALSANISLSSLIRLAIFSAPTFAKEHPGTLRTVEYSTLPQLSQKYLSTGLPLLVAVSEYSFGVPLVTFRSWVLIY